MIGFTSAEKLFDILVQALALPAPFSLLLQERKNNVIIKKQDDINKLGLDIRKALEATQIQFNGKSLTKVVLDSSRWICRSLFF